MTRIFFAAVAILVLSLCYAPGGQAQTLGDSLDFSRDDFANGPLEVGVGIKIDQITFVDQQAENFGVVGTLVMKFNYPALGFDREEYGFDMRAMQVSAMREYAAERKVALPAFTVQNQQGRRFIQQEQVIVSHDGNVTYVERFSVTLQAPHFDFRKYPFDTQQFFFEVSSLFPQEFVIYHPLNDLSGLGSMLGEEEWIMSNPRMMVTTVPGPTGLETSQIHLTFEAKRHVLFYIIRMMLPLLIILFVSWATFFLEEYRRRIDMANANLLVFVAFNFAISGTLPRLGYLTFMDSLLVGMFVITGSMVLVNIALRWLKINDHEDLARKFDRYLVIWIYPLIYAGALFWATQVFL